MRRRALAFALGAFALAGAAPQPKPTYIDVPPGVRIPVKLDQRLSSQDAASGDAFAFETTATVSVGTLTVATGTRGNGVVEYAVVRHGARSGQLYLSVRGIDLGGGRIIPVALPADSRLAQTSEEHSTGAVPIPVYGKVIVAGGDVSSGNVVLEKGTQFDVVTVSTATPAPLPTMT